MLLKFPFESSIRLNHSAASSGDGGSPIRSRNTRRINARESARCAGERPSSCSRFKMNRSISLTLHSSPWGLGTSGRVGRMNDQCCSYFAPELIHRISNSFSSGLRVLFDDKGGICSSGSFDRIRRTNSLSCELPGRIAPLSVADSNSSSRRSASRVSSSGP